MLKWLLGWHLGDRDGPGKGDELWLLGGHHMSFMITQDSPEVTVLLPLNDPFCHLLGVLPWCWGQAGGGTRFLLSHTCPFNNLLCVIAWKQRQRLLPRKGQCFAQHHSSHCRILRAPRRSPGLRLV